LVICGSAVSSSTGVSALRDSIRSLLKTVTGSTFSKSRRFTLEPVTWKASIFDGLVLFVRGNRLGAKAGGRRNQQGKRPNKAAPEPNCLQRRCHGVCQKMNRKN
jgi:hypothetical protein